ncbi:MAG: hypothetical protein Tsb0015_16240 [Simkaniaceae bacterium]
MEQQQEQFNPWLHIWVHPRNTIQKIIERNPNYRLTALSFIYGFPWLLSVAQSFSLGRFYSAWAILLVALVLAIPVGYILISISAFFFMWLGKLIRGAGGFLTIRSAIAWANVPNAVSIVIWLILAGFFKEAAFNSDFAKETSYAGYLMGAFLIQVIFAVWAFILLLHTLGQVQNFSAWMALLNTILVGIVYLALIFGGKWLLGQGKMNV